MQSKLSLLFAGSIVVLLSIIDTVAQAATSCPRIEVTGPAGIARSGELIRFTAVVRGAADSLQPTYTWSVSSGKIVSGEGTRSILVDNEERGITATVEISGLPSECPNTMSETYHYPGDRAPVAEKFYEVPGHQALSDLNKGFLTNTLRKYPNNQLYVIIHGKNDASNAERQNELVQAFKSKGFAPDRITMVTVFWEPNVTQFWRIPPGAENPEPGQFGKHDEVNSCPSISVTGPAGVTGPGDLMTFSADLRGELPQDLLYAWTITHAKIVDGQGTLRITARKSDDLYSPNPVATFEVRGLPKGCPNSASATDPTVIDPGPIQLGEINNPSYTIDRVLLVMIGKEMRANPTSQLYVWIYSVQSERQVERIRSHVLGQLSTTKINPSRFTLSTSSERPRGAVFWRIMPGVENPAP